MSGHSKWAKIKRQKGITDQKRGAVFNKLGRNITMATKEGGPDPDSNFTLRLCIDKAKTVNMPSENIERAIKKGSGGDDKTTVQRMSYEAMAHNGVALIIDCQTDNTNRAIAEVKNAIEGGGAKLASIGSVSWQFDEIGYIEIQPAKLHKAEKYGAGDTYTPINIDELQMELMEIDGILDIVEGENEDEDGNTYKVLEITTDKISFARIAKDLIARQLQIMSYELIKKAKEPVEIDASYQEKINHLVESLEELDDVDTVWLNLK